MTMTKPGQPGHQELTQHACYGLLSSAEFNERVSALPVSERDFLRLRSPLKTFAAGVIEDAYPAFQLDARLNQFLLSKVREFYRLQNLSEVFIWDFLRTRHKFLGGGTGVDFLLGCFSPEIAAMTPKEREDHFLDLIHEEIGQLSQ
jgi:hypothetical protein